MLQKGASHEAPFSCGMGEKFVQNRRETDGLPYKKVPDGTFNDLAFAMNCALHMNWLRHELHLTVHEDTKADSIHIGGAFA